MYRIKDRLTIDAATLRDLEVLSSSTANGPTLLRLVDRTYTRAGRDSLRRRLAAPQRIVSDILKIQAAHQELAADAAAFGSVLRASCADDVEQYLDSNWQTPTGRGAVERLVQSVWNPPWYREYAAFAARGRRDVAALLDAASRLRTLLESCKSALLREAGKSLTATLAQPEVRILLETASTSARSAREQFDSVARDAAKPVLRDLIGQIGVIESWWSIGAAAAEHNWVYPVPSSRLQFTGLVHPFLSGSATGNNLTLAADVRVCFVTGPNMAGKSTFLKAVALAIILGTLLQHSRDRQPCDGREFLSG